MSRIFNPYTEQQAALGTLGNMLGRIDAERAAVAEEYATKWTAEKRAEAEKSGDALPGGKFPIRDQEDLNNAVRLAGNSDVSEDRVRTHIKKQAKKHGLSLPSSFADAD